MLNEQGEPSVHSCTPDELEMPFIVGGVNLTQGGTFKGERLPLLINKLVSERLAADIDALFEFRLEILLPTNGKMELPTMTWRGWRVGEGWDFYFDVFSTGCTFSGKLCA